jgi:UDP-glucose 4-epimerase
MKILVTGGRGFVGSYVVTELRDAGHEVKVLSNLSHPSKNTEGWEYEYGDIRYEYDINKAADVDCIIHLAAKINVDRSREDSRPYFDTNILGTFNVLEVVRKRGIKLVHASTSEALGSMQCEMNESHPYSPDNPYGATKAAVDMLVLGWIKSFDIRASILRSFNITGVGQSYDKEGAFIPKTIESIINDTNPVIFGSGNQTRDYVWAGDIARAYRLMAEQDVNGEIIHFGTGTETSIESVAQKLINISGKPLKIEYRSGRPKEVKRLKCNYDKAKRLLGWQPTKFIDEILKEMYEYRLMQEFE